MTLFRRAHAALAVVFVAGLLVSAAALAADTQAASASERSEAFARTRDALGVISTMLHAPDKAMPANMLRNAYAVAVIPNVIKAGLVFGARRGHGLISIKHDHQWSNPSFITVTGGSIGLQVGVSSTDVLLIFRSPRGVDSIVNGKLTLGTDLAVAAGPVGRSAQAATDTQLKASIYAYSRSRGLFAGFSFQGAVLRMDSRANAAVYGPGITAQTIFAGTLSHVPAPMTTFRKRLAEYTAP